MPKAPAANAVRVRFTADRDWTPDHRTFAYKAGQEMAAAALFEPFAVDTVADLVKAFAAYAIPAELVGAQPIVG